MAQMFFHCKHAEIPDPQGGASIRAQVSVGPMGGLLLEVPYSFKQFTDDPIEIVFLDPIMGAVTCLVTLYAPLVTEGRTSRSYRCKVLRKLSQNQRREDAKVPVSDVVTVRLDGTNAGGEASATLRNISAGGVYLVTDLNANPGDLLLFTFNCNGQALPVAAKILRVEQEKKRRGRTMFGYGCRFVNLSVGFESALRSYVYQEERRLYGKN